MGYVILMQRIQLSFSTALAHSKTLQILTDIGESHAAHSSQAFLGRDNVKKMMMQVPKLKKLVTVDRIWSVRKFLTNMFYIHDLNSSRSATSPKTGTRVACS